VHSVLSEPFIEDKIAYMTGFSWHWDIDGSGFPVGTYRNVHLRLLEPYGFREFVTNEPNINLRAENIFMARIGSRVSPEDQKRFGQLRFGIKV
jgi:acetoin utilization protein AcuA